MPVKQKRLIFELSTTEKEQKLGSTLSNAMRKAAALNLPIIYRNELCVKPNLFVHKYPNGRKELVEQDSESFAEKTLQILH